MRRKSGQHDASDRERFLVGEFIIPTVSKTNANLFLQVDNHHLECIYVRISENKYKKH